MEVEVRQMEILVREFMVVEIRGIMEIGLMLIMVDVIRDRVVVAKTATNNELEVSI